MAGPNAQKKATLSGQCGLIENDVRSAAGTPAITARVSVVLIDGRGAVLAHRSILDRRADHPVFPDRTTAVIVADEIFLCVDRRAAGTVAADVGVARWCPSAVGLGIGSGCRSCDGKSGDGECSECCFHILV